MDLKAILILIVCSLTLIVSCGNNTTFVTSEDAMSEAIEVAPDWMNNAACSIPCWENITPGTTSLTQIEEMPDAESLPFGVEEVAYTANGAYSLLYVDIYTKRPIAKIVYEKVKGKYIVVLLRLEQSTRTIEDIIQHFGPPSHVYATANPSTDERYSVYQYYVLWVDQGIGIDLRSSTVQVSEVSMDTIPETIIFFEPTVEALTRVWKVEHNLNLLDALAVWEDTLDFNHYCKGPTCEE